MNTNDVIIISMLVPLAGILGAVVMRHWLFRKSSSAAPTATYEVRLTRWARGHAYSRTLYEGDDLQMAKEIYKNAEGPAKAIAELYTRGSHTASRRV